MDVNNFQRIGSVSNSHVGREFEDLIQKIFSEKGEKIQKEYGILLGIRTKKLHRFDLGGEDVIIECKSHKWTNGDNIPSAKLTVWNEAMYYFMLAPIKYRKIFCILRDYSDRRDITLGEYYINTYLNMIPSDVEIHEYDETTKVLKRLL